MMIAYRLVRLIEAHSDQLAAALMRKLKNDPKICSYGDVPSQEFHDRVLEMYQHLGEWLLGRTEADIERRYTEIGRRRAEQGVPLSQLVCAINLVKHHLLEFLADESVQDQAIEVFGELEILQLLEHFFDRAIYYAAVGYEHAHATRAAAAVGNS